MACGGDCGCASCGGKGGSSATAYAEPAGSHPAGCDCPEHSRGAGAGRTAHRGVVQPDGGWSSATSWAGGGGAGYGGRAALSPPQSIPPRPEPVAFVPRDHATGVGVPATASPADAAPPRESQGFSLAAATPAGAAPAPRASGSGGPSALSNQWRDALFGAFGQPGKGGKGGGGGDQAKPQRPGPKPGGGGKARSRPAEPPQVPSAPAGLVNAPEGGPNDNDAESPPQFETPTLRVEDDPMRSSGLPTGVMAIVAPTAAFPMQGVPAAAPPDCAP